MARRARRAANLVPGASLRGLVFDACFDNRIPNTFGMLRHFGMPNRNRVLVSESPHLDTAGLATALRIDESEVLLRRYPAHGRGHRVFFGLHVMKSRIEDRVRRFSPAAIAAGNLHHPATHELRDLPFSTVGWDMLRDTCPCEENGVRQNWVRVNGSTRCHSCGGSLARITAVPVPIELRSSLEFVAGLVDPDPAVQNAALGMLPAGIRGAGRTLLYDAVMNIARAVSTEADAGDFHTRIDTLARACRALIRWPAGFEEIDRSVDCPTNLWDWVRRTYSILDAGGQATAVGSATNTTAPTGTKPGPLYVPSGSKGRIKTKLLSAMAAARLGGVDEQALKRAWDVGKFTQHVWVLGSSRVRAFDPPEVLIVAPKLRVAGPRAMAAKHLGLPVYGLEQLLERGLFVPTAPGAGVKQVEAHMDAARSFATSIEGAKSSVIGSPVPFLDAIRHVSGRPKPWGAAFGILLNGAMPFDLGKGARANGIVGRIVVGHDAISKIVAMPHDSIPTVEIERSKTWSGVDALECLNGNRSASELLNGLANVGTGKKRLFLVSDVLERAAAGVTTFDLTRRSGIGTTRVMSILEADGVEQIAPGLWERRRAEELMLAPA